MTGTTVNKKVAFKKLVEQVSIEGVDTPTRGTILMNFCKENGLDQVEVFEGSNLEITPTQQDKISTRAVNPVWCKMFPWLCK